MSELKKAIGQTYVYTDVDCPYCHETIEIIPDEYGLEEGQEYGSKNLWVPITCNGCGEGFIIEGFEY